MRILISGGCKNGKSTLAQHLAAGQGERRAYIATMRPNDEEDRKRVERHRRERDGWGFETVECHRDIASLAGRFAPDTSLLLDSTTALLAEEMFPAGEKPDMQAGARVVDGLLRLMEVYENLVIVSDTIYSDALKFDSLTEAYREALAGVERTVALKADAVLEMVFGQRITHKGDERLASLLHKAPQGVCDGIGPVHGHTGIRPLG